MLTPRRRPGAARRAPRRFRRSSTGDGALARELRWAHVIEMPDPTTCSRAASWCSRPGSGRGRAPRARRPGSASLIEQGAAAVAVELGHDLARASRRRWSTRALRPACRSWPSGAPVRFVEITEAVHGAVLNRQFELLRRGEEIHRRFTELILQGRGVPEILAELRAGGRATRSCSRTPGGELVYYVSQPPRAGDDVTLSAWADLHRAEDRGEAPEGAMLVEVRLMDSSWGRLMALAIDERRWTTSTASPSSARRSRSRSTCSASSTRSTCARARAARSCPTSPTGAWRRPTRAAAPRRSDLPAPRAALLPVVATWLLPVVRALARRARVRAARSPTASPGRGSRAICARALASTGSACCSARATSTC